MGTQRSQCDRRDDILKKPDVGRIKDALCKRININVLIAGARRRHRLVQAVICR